MEILSNHPFQLLVANISGLELTLTIPKRMLVGRGAGEPGRSVEVSPIPKDNKYTPMFNLVYDQTAASCESQMETARNVTQEDEDRLKDD